MEIERSYIELTMALLSIFVISPRTWDPPLFHTRANLFCVTRIKQENEWASGVYITRGFSLSSSSAYRYIMRITHTKSTSLYTSVWWRLSDNCLFGWPSLHCVICHPMEVRGKKRCQKVPPPSCNYTTVIVADTHNKYRTAAAVTLWNNNSSWDFPSTCDWAKQ